MPSDIPSAAIEVGGRLYEFRKIPFRVTNEVASFQRMAD